MHRFITCLLAAALAGSASAVDVIFGEYTSDADFHYTVYGVPDFDQLRATSESTTGLPNSGRVYCAPTAATNLMAWIANHGYASLPPGPDSWNLYTESHWDDEARERYNDVTDVIQAMAEAMDTDVDKGTGSRGIVRGLYHTFEDYLPGGYDEFRVYQLGVDGGDWVDRRYQIPRIAAACQMLIDGGVAIMRWGYYDWDDSSPDGNMLAQRTGGHLVSVTSIDRVGDDTIVAVSNPGSSDTALRQSDFESSRYRVEEVEFILPSGAVDLRQVLMREGQTWADLSAGGSGHIKCIDEFTFITPRHGFSLPSTLDGIQLHRLDPFAGTVETELVTLPAGEIVVDASLGPDQLGALLVIDNGSGMRLAQYDLNAETFTDVVPLQSVEAMTLTRHGTVIVREGPDELTHINPHDLANPIIAQQIASTVNGHLDVDDETDTLWMLSTDSSSLRTFSLPDLTPTGQLFLPTAVIWVEPIDFAVDAGGHSVWIVNDGAVRRVYTEFDPPDESYYPTPFPAEAITADEFGAVTITMHDGAERLVRRYLPDDGQLEPLPSALLDQLGDVGVGFERAVSSTNVDPALFDNPGSDDLDVETILGTFNDPEPPEAGVLCPAVDTFEDLAQGTVVTARSIDGVTISMATDTGEPIYARNYGPAGGHAYYGADGDYNRPFAPGQVSGARFVTASSTSSSEAFQDHQPIRFTFSRPIEGFGLTTEDLLEYTVAPTETIALRAYDADGALVDEHERAGVQGPSGVVLRWHVHSDAANIVRVELGGTLAHGGRYGLDDFELCAGPCATDLDGDGMVGFSDLLTVLAAWGPCAGCGADLDGDGTVGFSDLLTVLALWGPCS